jgi:FlaG/FlaF family flagellin (archaellin)
VFRKKFEKFLKDRRAVSDALVILLLIAIGAVVAAGIGAVLLTKTPKQTAPVANIVIEPVTGGIKIKHEGGDSINAGDIKLMIYNYPSMTAAQGFDQPQPLSFNNGVDVPPTNMFSTGDVVSVSLSAGTYEVDLIYIPTQTKLVKQVVTVGG